MSHKAFYSFTCKRCGEERLDGREPGLTECALCKRHPELKTREELLAYKDRVRRAEVKMVDGRVRCVIPEK